MRYLLWILFLLLAIVDLSSSPAFKVNVFSNNSFSMILENVYLNGVIIINYGLLNMYKKTFEFTQYPLKFLININRDIFSSSIKFQINLLLVTLL